MINQSIFERTVSLAKGQSCSCRSVEVIYLNDITTLHVLIIIHNWLNELIPRLGSWLWHHRLPDVTTTKAQPWSKMLKRGISVYSLIEPHGITTRRHWKYIANIYLKTLIFFNRKNILAPYQITLLLIYLMLFMHLCTFSVLFLNLKSKMKSSVTPWKEYHFERVSHLERE